MNSLITNLTIIEETGVLDELTEKDFELLRRLGTRMGRNLCYYLRHHPENIGLTMNPYGGWVRVTELIDKYNATAPKNLLSLPLLMEIVRTDHKQRYGLRGKLPNLEIRCHQGHSIEWLIMDYQAMTPPDRLYHGTSSDFLDAICKKGIRPMNRQYVHLSADFDTAVAVANRRKKGTPVILEIDTGTMHENGIKFYLADNGVWLTDYVDPKYFVKDSYI